MAMSAGNAIFAGLALVATAIYLGNAQPVMSQNTQASPGFGPWNMKDVKQNEVVWKLNSSNGEIFRCSDKECVKMEAK
jgi:hypothetical protein